MYKYVKDPTKHFRFNIFFDPTNAPRPTPV